MSTQPQTNDITALRDMLFKSLRDMQAADSKDQAAAIERARAMSDVSQTIINSVKAEIDFAKVTGKNSTSGFIPVAELPKLAPGKPVAVDIENPRISYPEPGVTRHTCK